MSRLIFPWTVGLLTVGVLCLMAVPGRADETSSPPAPEAVPQDAAADSNQAASVTDLSERTPPPAGPGDLSGELPGELPEAGGPQDVMEQLLEQRRAAPVVAPTRDPAVHAQPSRVGAPAATVDLDPAIIGIAPGGEPPELLPEGAFVVSRRGRMARSRDGVHVLFIFEADSADAPEPPMLLLPCRKLQDMEDYVEKHGDQTVFKITGQAHIYRGANYLMPTMMVPDLDRGNLNADRPAASSRPRK